MQGNNLCISLVSRKMNRKKNSIKPEPKDAIKVFLKMGTCSRTFFYLLNREFGVHTQTQEHAADPLAGGILQKGYQCGMLWGASLAVGAEAYRRYNDTDRAIWIAIKATQNLMDSFKERTNTISCREITHCDFFLSSEMLNFQN